MKPTSHPAFEADFKAFLDGELPFWRRVQVRRHLQTCPQCREEIEFMQTIGEELQTEESAPLEADLRAKILDQAPVEAPITAPKKQIRLVPALGLSALLLGVCASVLFPTFSRSRENARRSSNQSYLKQIPLGIAQYSQDYDESFPNAPSAAPMAGAASASGAAPMWETANRAKNSPTVGDKREADANYSFSDGHSKSLNSSSLRRFQTPDGIYDVVPAQRQVHKQGSLSVAVDDAEAQGSAVEILVKNAGGFVANNALSTGSDGRKSATLDVRIPVASFESIVAKIGKLGVVREKSVNGEDITQQVTRAGAQQQSVQNELSIREAQLRALSPKKVAARQNIIADVRQLRFQANQARAQLEYLRKFAALSTLYVTLQDKAKVVTPAGWTSGLGQTGSEAWSSFLVTAKLPIQLLIWVLAYAPLWLPALLVWKKFGRKWLAAP